MNALKSFSLLALLVLACTGCGGGLDVCTCDKESQKDNPDKEMMEKCRDLFSKMEFDEVMEALKACK